MCVAVPYHQDIYVKSGYGSLDAKAGHSLFTEYQMAPRAQIFRRDVGKVASMADMEHMMRQNGKRSTQSHTPVLVSVCLVDMI